MNVEENDKGYRDRFAIIRDILSVTKNAGRLGSKKTHIMYGANLSYKLLTRYIGHVLDAGLITYDGERYYRITDRGREFLRVYEDYERECIEVRKHNARLSYGKDELENMLVLTR